jgi:hypothetical protein
MVVETIHGAVAECRNHTQQVAIRSEHLVHFQRVACGKETISMGCKAYGGAAGWGMQQVMVNRQLLDNQRCLRQFRHLRLVQEQSHC